MAWLWTDALAALLVEQDRVAPERLASWVHHPVAYRSREGEGALSVARSLLAAEERAGSDRWAAPAA